MIALNEILKNREFFENKYKLMGKKVNFDQIFSLEEKFIVLDKKANESRANCNKLCAEVANLINNGKDVKDLILQINKLDKNICKLEKKSKLAMKKINKILLKLPNIAISENVLNIPLKTKPNDNFNKENFIAEIGKISEIKQSNQSLKSYLINQKNVVLKSENLPEIINFSKNTSKKYDFLMLSDSNSIITFNNIVNILTQNAKYVTEKSIKYLNKQSSKEITAMLCDKTIVNVEFLGEFVSREISLKFYDKAQDMTRFVNMIKVEIKE